MKIIQLIGSISTYTLTPYSESRLLIVFLLVSVFTFLFFFFFFKTSIY